MRSLPRREGQANMSLCHKLPSPCQQAPHRFALHHLGVSESRRTQRGLGGWIKTESVQEKMGERTDGGDRLMAEQMVRETSSLMIKAKIDPEVMWRQDEVSC